MLEKELVQIERANESNWLWPPIADAVDTFIRRREHADAYERIWRLIHIWESIATTLSGAVAAQLASTDHDVAPMLLKVREHLYGLSYDKINKGLKSRLGAFDGSNDERIAILGLVHKADHLPTNFLVSLQKFLKWPFANEDVELAKSQALAKAISNLLELWNRVCDVPALENVSVFRLIQLINVFRNRYAHVPFPYDPIASIAESLQELTELLFSIEPPPGRHDSVLCGAYLKGKTLWRGCQTYRWKVTVHTPS